jgi:hypothetical protein
MLFFISGFLERWPAGSKGVFQAERWSGFLNPGVGAEWTISGNGKAQACQLGFGVGALDPGRPVGGCREAYGSRIDERPKRRL